MGWVGRLTRAAFVLAMLLACCPGVLALDPSLDVSQYAHTAWKVREGFTKGTIVSIAQTPDGYLWLGTEFGLLRFDGVRSVPWQPPPGQHLPSTYIRRLLVARDGTLWIGTWKGLASWEDGKLTQYPELAGQIISALLEDREGTVWPAGRRFLLQGSYAQFTVALLSASGRTALLAMAWPACSRTAKAISGWER